MSRKKPRHRQKGDGRSSRRISVNHELVDWQGTWDVVEYWEDSEYSCRGCHKSFVFSAADKREWYEVQGRGYNSSPSYCDTCYSQLFGLRKKARELERLKLNDLTPEQLEQARDVFERMIKLNDRYNRALYRGIRKRIVQDDHDDR